MENLYIVLPSERNLLHYVINDFYDNKWHSVEYEDYEEVKEYLRKKFPRKQKLYIGFVSNNGNLSKDNITLR